MARFHVYAPRSGYFVLDVQADLPFDFDRRVVVPLLRRSQVPRPSKYLQPVFVVEHIEVVMVTNLLTNVAQRSLGRPTGNLAHYRDDITRALDMLFTGF